MPTKLDSSAPHLEGPAQLSPARSRTGAFSRTRSAGQSKSDGVLLHKGPNGQPEVGLWQCTPGTWPLEIPRDELCHFVVGPRHLCP